jgi:hypothetical protein
LEKYSGRSYYKRIPRSREHAKDGAAADSAFLGWLSRWQERRRPFLAFLDFTAITAQRADCHIVGSIPDINASPDNPDYVRSPGLTLTFFSHFGGGVPISSI